MENQSGSPAVYRCPTGHKVFTRSPGRWCPLCEKDYIPADESPEELLAKDYTEDCEENQWLFFDYPLLRSAREGLAAAGLTDRTAPVPRADWADQDTITMEPIREE